MESQGFKTNKNQNRNSPKPPIGRAVIGQNSLPPIKQTYSILIEASIYCAFNYYHKIWNKINVKTYNNKDCKISQQVRFDTQIKNCIIFKYYVV